mgnify:CR=1 FL=1
MNWSEFLSMGGYGLYVWGSYAVTAVVLILNVLAARVREKNVRRQLRETAELNQKGAE